MKNLNASLKTHDPCLAGRQARPKTLIGLVVLSLVVWNLLVIAQGCGQVQPSGGGGGAGITWNNKISQHVNTNCIGCHDGQTAYQATYDEVKTRALNGKLKEKVIDGTMGGLDATQKSDFQSWIDAGAPQ